MERGSDKHGPRLDEEQKKEIEGLERGAPVDPRVEEFRKTEDTEDVGPRPGDLEEAGAEEEEEGAGTRQG